MSTVPARVAEVVSRQPDTVAIQANGRSVTYAQFWDEARAFAAALRARGIAPGDRVAILLPNGVESASAVYGAWLAGAIAVPLNVQAKSREFIAWLRHCEARHVVHEASHADAREALDALGDGVTAWSIGPGLPLVAADGPREVVAHAVEPGATAIILYTSGTTGAPKGVELTHANLFANAEAVLAYLQLGPQDSVLSVLAFYYAYGASVLHTHLMAGARLVLAQNLLFPHLLMETVAHERITGFSGVPSTFALLLERVRLQDHDLSSLRYLTQAGGAMAPVLTERLRAAIPHARLFVMYGQTEATSRLTWLPPERLDEKLGSVGIPVQGVELRVLREDGSEAAAGETGDVHVRGANVMRGYWRDPAATAQVLQDGWLRTGDMGHQDADGFLWLAGRRSDMIKTGAHRVHPLDVEEALLEMPGILEAAVVGIDDDVLGQVIRAYVVAPALPPDGAQRVKAHCRDRLAVYKIPRDIVFVPALPRTASGKVRRAALLEPQSCP